MICQESSVCKYLVTVLDRLACSDLAAGFICSLDNPLTLVQSETAPATYNLPCKKIVQFPYYSETLLLT
ncbi:hypothetical protein M378DRAFT_1007057 [Amanita muscaria Koide BX008]|uniref:Uncharacterized protein n=1 Tax=Amanita muscaria (strain Koide BX008) TaxID=946122 RepID=A0A0C2S9N3_AMAMK|nr:hypothetical protein M378DRAFT_1007057 [Amanita muscaria Koide BX008]